MEIAPKDAGGKVSAISKKKEPSSRPKKEREPNSEVIRQPQENQNGSDEENT